MEFFSCDANLVNFFEKIKLFTASLSLALKDTPLTGKKYKGVSPSRGGVEMKKRMARVSHPLKDLIIITICYNFQLSILFRFHSN